MNETKTMDNSDQAKKEQAAKLVQQQLNMLRRITLDRVRLHVDFQGPKDTVAEFGAFMVQQHTEDTPEQQVTADKKALVQHFKFLHFMAIAQLTDDEINLMHGDFLLSQAQSALYTAYDAVDRLLLHRQLVLNTVKQRNQAAATTTAAPGTNAKAENDAQPS